MMQNFVCIIVTFKSLTHMNFDCMYDTHYEYQSRNQWHSLEFCQQAKIFKDIGPCDLKNEVTNPKM